MDDLTPVHLRDGTEAVSFRWCMPIARRSSTSTSTSPPGPGSGASWLRSRSSPRPCSTPLYVRRPRRPRALILTDDTELPLARPDHPLPRRPHRRGPRRHRRRRMQAAVPPRSSRSSCARPQAWSGSSRSSTRATAPPSPCSGGSARPSRPPSRHPAGRGRASRWHLTPHRWGQKPARAGRSMRRRPRHPAQSSGRSGPSTNSVNFRCRSRASHSPLVSSRLLAWSVAKISSIADATSGSISSTLIS